MTAKKKPANVVALPTGGSARAQIEERLTELSREGALTRTAAAIRRGAAGLDHAQRSRNVPFSKKRREEFLAALGEGLTVASAAQYAGVSVRNVYIHRGLDARFAEQWEDALEASLGQIEERLMEIALYGEMNSMATVRAAEALLRRRERQRTIEKATQAEKPKVIIMYDDGLTPE
jgi:hypothetical protein